MILIERHRNIIIYKYYYSTTICVCIKGGDDDLMIIYSISKTYTRLFLWTNDVFLFYFEVNLL